MPFEDFYEKSDKVKYRYRKSVLSTFALSAVVFISFYGLYLIYEDHRIESARQSARVKQIDAFCTELPKAPLFNLIKRENPVAYRNNSATEIIYRYQGDSQVIIPQFIEWFSANGWKRRSDNELIFTKDRQTITVKSADNYFSQYDIHCYEEDISFGIYD